MTDELVAFLKVRLDEDEQAARAASERGEGHAEHWRWESTETDTPVPDADLEEASYHQGLSLRSVETYPTTSGVGDLPSFALHRVDQYSPAMPHIARWDPARVRAEVQAKRRIIEALEIAERHTAEIRRTAPEYRGVQQAEGPRDALLYAVRLLALPYAGHDGYRAEWAPDEEVSRG